MKGKIISIIIIFLMIFGIIDATGFNNCIIKEELDLHEQYPKIIKEFESDCDNCAYDGYHLGLLGDPFVIIEPEKLVELGIKL